MSLTKRPSDTESKLAHGSVWCALALALIMVIASPLTDHPLSPFAALVFAAQLWADRVDFRRYRWATEQAFIVLEHDRQREGASS